MITEGFTGVKDLVLLRPLVGCLGVITGLPDNYFMRCEELLNVERQNHNTDITVTN